MYLETKAEQATIAVINQIVATTITVVTTRTVSVVAVAAAVCLFLTRYALWRFRITNFMLTAHTVTAKSDRKPCKVIEGFAGYRLAEHHFVNVSWPNAIGTNSTYYSLSFPFPLLFAFTL